MKRPIIPLIAAGVAALCALGSARANGLGDGLAAFKRHDFASAMALLRPLADHGDAAAQLHVGIMDAFGQGVPQDKARAIDWYRRAAEQGNGEAQARLGEGYEAGNGTKQDFATALCSSHNLNGHPAQRGLQFFGSLHVLDYTATRVGGGDRRTKQDHGD
jgi:TPR repeat protein